VNARTHLHHGKFHVKANIHFTLRLFAHLTLGAHLGCHLDFHFTPDFKSSVNAAFSVCNMDVFFLSLPIWLGTKVLIFQPKRGFHLHDWNDHSPHTNTQAHTKTLIGWVLSFCLGPILFLRIPHYIYIYIIYYYYYF
jgi:hypothetical protein